MVKKAIVIFFLFLSFLVILLYNRPFATYNVTQFPTQIVQTGDVIFTVGHSWKSDIVRRQDDNNPYRYSHVGFIYKDKGDSYSIVHMSIDSGMILRQPLELFFKTNGVEDIGIYRIKGQYDQLRLKVKIDSVFHCGKEFDYNFSMSNNSQYYCTEFVIKTIQETGISGVSDLSGQELVRPSDLSNSLVLTPIKLPSLEQKK